MKTAYKSKRRSLRLFAAALTLMLFFAASGYSQCNFNENGYVFLHPAFANKNWGKAWYDSVNIIVPETLCTQKPVRYDICGPADKAIAVFSNAANELFLMKTEYLCPQPRPVCLPCILEYLDPSMIPLTGIDLEPNTPLYLVKGSFYGVDSVKILVKNSQKKVIALTLSTEDLSVVHIDTLATSAFSAQQNIVRIQGAYDTATHSDAGVWLLGSGGLMRYFPITNGKWGVETKRDIPGVSDTVYCVNNGFAGTSTGSIYKKSAGGAYIFDKQPANAAITGISGRGAVGNKGVFLDYNGTNWNLQNFGSADYRYANFINRWDGYGVELLDSDWHRTAYTYRRNPSSITAVNPSSIMPFINNGSFACFNYDLNDSSRVITVTVTDPDASFSDVSIDLKTGGKQIDMKDDGVHAISGIPPDSQCVVGALRLKSGVVTCTLTQKSVKISAVCELGKRDASCPWPRNVRADYAFVSSHVWAKNDILTFVAGDDTLRLANQITIVGTDGHLWFGAAGAASVSHKVAGGMVVFSVTQGATTRLTHIALFDVSGKTLASAQVIGNSGSVSLRAGTCGVVYARYSLSNGSSFVRPILLVR
jgi:hypothetical protein